MKIIEEKISIDELRSMALEMYGDLVKAVVDVNNKILAIDAELHADLEKILLEQGSRQKDLWGINLYPEIKGEDFLEFDSMINLRPAQGNRSRGVDDEATRDRIRTIVNNKIIDGIPT